MTLVLARFPVLLLDMNSTFMFGEDRFGPAYDYAATYASLGGTLPGDVVASVIQACYDHLAACYPDPHYHNAFPTVADILAKTKALPETERRVLEQTFALHEIGHISKPYAEVVQYLARTHRLGLVADIWSAKDLWLAELERAGLRHAFEVLVFSSDHGCVKPSPRPFQIAAEQMGVAPEVCLVIGDSARRDVGGAQAAGMAALWIGDGDPPAGATCTALDLIYLTGRHAA